MNQTNIVQMEAPKGKIYKRISEDGVTYLRKFRTLNPAEWELVDESEYHEWLNEQQGGDDATSEL